MTWWGDVPAEVEEEDTDGAYMCVECDVNGYGDVCWMCGGTKLLMGRRFRWPPGSGGFQRHDPGARPPHFDPEVIDWTWQELLAGKRDEK